MPKYRFSEIAFNSTAKKKPTEADKDTYIGLEHLDSGSLTVSRWGSDVAPIGEKLIMKKGDVLFGKRRAYQKKVAIAPFDGIFSAHGMVLRPNEAVITQEYFPLFISSDYFLDEAIRISVGSLSPTVNWKDLKDLSFNIPTIEEQRRITPLVWAAIESKYAYIALLERTDELVKSQFIEMFGDPITNDIVERIGHMIFADIYTTKKYRYGKYDFAFDQMVDGTAVGVLTGGMRLRFLTVATDAPMKSDFRLMSETKGKEAAVVLADTPYYESLESAMKIRKYVKQRNISQLPKSVQDIIRDQQEEANKFEISALEELRRAIVEATFYADGERLDFKGGDAKSRIDQALEYLVSHVYSELGLITWNAETDADILSVFNGTANDMLAYGMQRNQEAADRMYEFLEIQDNKKLPTSMADIQSRYSAIPYGWREIDIAAVAAKLIYDQRVTIKYAGMTIQPDNPKLPDMLRKKSEIGKTSISKRHVLSLQKMKQAREFLRDFFDVMDVPSDEDGLIRFIVEKFTDLRNHYEDLSARYSGHKYPDHSLVVSALALVNEVLSQQKDNEALIARMLAKQDDLDETREKLASLESFFATQVDTFDRAVRFEADLRNDLDYIAKDEETNKALNTIRLICLIPSTGSYNYKRIPELNSLMDTVRKAHDKMLEEKRAELLEVVRQCMADIHGYMNAGSDTVVRPIILKADDFFSQKKQRIAETTSLALLDGMMPPMWTYKDDTLHHLEAVTRPEPSKPVTPPKPNEPPKPKKMIKSIYRQSIFPAKRLESESDIDAYVEQIRKQLLAYMKGSDGIDLK